MLVRIRIPARDVVLAIEKPQGISIHNCLSGRVTRITPLPDGSTVAVLLAIGDLSLLAHVTCDAIDQLSLSVGSSAFALIKSVAIDAMQRAVSSVVSQTSRAEPRQ
jgi:molybdate transport system ATP-binding protein